jgi:hypothetical protein
MTRNLVRIAAVCMLGTFLPISAPAASVPYTFTPGGLASAAEMNANFAALAAAVTALEDKVDPHTMATLAGTYDYVEVRIDVDNLGATSNSIAGAGTSGTVVLNENGTGHADLSTSYRQLTFNAVTNGDKTLVNSFYNTPSTDNVGLAWSFADGTVSIAGAGSFTVVGRLLIRSIVNEEGHNGILILARRQVG